MDPTEEPQPDHSPEAGKKVTPHWTVSILQDGEWYDLDEKGNPIRTHSDDLLPPEPEKFTYRYKAALAGLDQLIMGADAARLNRHPPLE